MKLARFTFIYALILALSQTQVAADSIAIPSKDASWLETLNYYRQSSQTDPVVENAAQSSAALKHSIYLAKTDPKYLTGQYENPHTENPESPFYTKEGANSGTNLTGEGRESDAIDSWMQAPLHAIGLLRDNLKTTGFASVLDERTNRYHTGLDVMNGLVGTRKKIVTFPGNGAVIRLREFTGETPDPRESCGINWKEFRGLPLFASLLNSPPRDVRGVISTPSGMVLTDPSELCLVTEYSWKSTDKVIPYGNRIMDDENLILLIPKSPLVSGQYSVTLTGTGMEQVNWKFTVLPPLQKLKPVFDLDKRVVTWDAVKVEAPHKLIGYTVIARDRNFALMKEYRTTEANLSTINWDAGEYFICVKIRSSFDESKCDFTYARVFEKLPNVTFSMDPSKETINWDLLINNDSNRKFEYIVKSFTDLRNGVTEYSTTGTQFSTDSWKEGDYFICVMARAPGAESECKTYYGYKIDRKPKAIYLDLKFLNPVKVFWNIDSDLKSSSKPTSLSISLRDSEKNQSIYSETLPVDTKEWTLPSLGEGNYEICIQGINPSGESPCAWRALQIRKRTVPVFTLDNRTIAVGELTYIRNDSNIAASFINQSSSVCKMRLSGRALKLSGIRAGKCLIEVKTKVNDEFLALNTTFLVTVKGKSSGSSKKTKP